MSENEMNDVEINEGTMDSVTVNEEVVANTPNTEEDSAVDVTVDVKKHKMFAPSPTHIKDIPIGQVVSNKQNPRKSVPALFGHGYGVFSKMDNSDKPSLVSLALSEDEADRENYVDLIEKQEPEIKSLADDLKIHGFLQNCVVRVLPQGGYDLEIGCRRTLAALYNYAKYGDKPIIKAVVTNDSDDRSRYKAFSENFHRRQMDPIEEAEFFVTLGKQGMKMREIAERSGVNEQTVRQRARLVELDKNQKEKVRSGEIPITKAIAYLDKGKEPGKEPEGRGFKGTGQRRSVPTLQEFQAMYQNEALDEKVREFIALRILQVDYVTLKELKKHKADAEAAAAKVGSKKKK